MTSLPPPATEPLTRGTALAGMRMALEEMWGEAGRRELAERLPTEARAATIDAIVLPINWYPTRYMLEWYVAMFDGPAKRDDAAACAFIDRGVDLGFGRIRRFFLRLSSIDMMASRAPEMWRREHTHGSMTATVGDDRRSATISVREHPFVSHPVSRRMEAEGYRHIVALSGYKDVREAHALEADGSLAVRLSWRA